MKICFVLLLFIVNVSFAQQSVEFIVTDQSDMPLIGVNLIVSGTRKGAVTDTESKAIISGLPDGKVKIEISYVGYEDQTLILNLPENAIRPVIVELEEEKEFLDEIIVSSVRSSRTIEDIPTRVELITEEELGE